jgi:hypothetical protein
VVQNAELKQELHQLKYQKDKKGYDQFVRGLLPARLKGELSFIEPVIPSKKDDFISETTTLDLNMSAEEC